MFKVQNAPLGAQSLDEKSAFARHPDGFRLQGFDDDTGDYATFEYGKDGDFYAFKKVDGGGEAPKQGVPGTVDEAEAPSTRANRPGKVEDRFNPDFQPSDGKSIAEQSTVGKGANPSADVITKHTTTIDPVRGEPSPTADGRTVSYDTPAQLPAESRVSAADGTVYRPGEEPEGTTLEATDPSFRLTQNAPADPEDAKPNPDAEATKRSVEATRGAPVDATTAPASKADLKRSRR